MTNHSLRHLLSLVLLSAPVVLFPIVAMALVAAGVEVTTRTLLCLTLAPIGCIVAGAGLLVIVRADDLLDDGELPSVEAPARDRTGIQGEAPGPASTGIRTDRRCMWRKE
jgi:hypothetical protein